MVSSLTRHLYRHRRVTPSSCANSLTSSQVLRRSTAIRWNFREYRFRFTLQPFPCKVCPSRLSHFKGAVQLFPNCRSAEQILEQIPGTQVHVTPFRWKQLQEIWRRGGIILLLFPQP